MSSVRNLLAAQPYVDSGDAGPDLPSEESLEPPPSPLEPWLVAFHAALNGPDATSFSSVWEDLAGGRLRMLREIITRDRVYLVAQVIALPSGLSEDDAAARGGCPLWRGAQGLAGNLGIAISTATGRFLRALARLGLADRNVSLPLVLAAQTRTGVARVPSARAAFFDYRRLSLSGRLRAATVDRTSGALTRSEQDVAQGLIEGLTRYEIAERRRTSSYTVRANFIRSLRLFASRGVMRSSAVQSSCIVFMSSGSFGEGS